MTTQTSKKSAPIPEPAALSIQPPDPQILSAAEKSYQELSAYVVIDQRTSEFAQGARASLNSQIRQLNEKRLSGTRQLDGLKKTIMGWFAPTLDYYQRTVDHLDAQIIQYDNAQEAIARAAQREADRKAEAERQRLLTLAGKAQARGDLDKADEFEDRAAVVVAPVVEKQSGAVAGTQIRETWGYEILDAKKISAAFMAPDLVAIGKTVRALGPDAAELIGAGVRIFSSKVLASRRV